jgi:hypothetical protein
MQLSQDFTDPTTGNDPAEIRRVIRNDAYLGLVMGIKSFDIWSMSENRPNFNTHNDQFLAYASVAKDLTGDLDLQKVFLFGEQRTDVKFQITSGTKQFPFTDVNGAKFKFDTLHTFDAAYGSDRYLFMVNSTEQPMGISVSGLPSNYIMDNLFAQTSAVMNQASISLTLDKLGVAALRFHPVSPPMSGGDDDDGGIVAIPIGGLFVSMVPEPTTFTLMALTAFSTPSIRCRRRIS